MSTRTGRRCAVTARTRPRRWDGSCSGSSTFAIRRAPALSDDVCIELQLANFAQDVSVDRRLGRTYLLQSDIREHGVEGATRAMCERARGLLASGIALEALAPPRLRVQLALYRLGGEAILDAIAAAGVPHGDHAPDRRWRSSRAHRRGSASAGLRRQGGRVGAGRGADRGRTACLTLPRFQTSARWSATAEDMARREAANFYWGFIALPRRQRTAIYALYDFARQVDDDADLDGRSSRDQRLEHHRRRLRETRPGDSTDPGHGVARDRDAASRDSARRAGHAHRRCCHGPHHHAL